LKRTEIELQPAQDFNVVEYPLWGQKCRPQVANVDARFSLDTVAKVFWHHRLQILWAVRSANNHLRDYIILR
jgi:hypothetical protein